MSPSRWTPAYVSIGSNLESPLNQVHLAVDRLGGLPDARFISVSGRYRSPPLCGREQPDYINAVAALLTKKSAHDFLLQLQALEDRQGRQRGSERWASRTLDLDLLAFGSQVIAMEELTVPHPGIAERNFVLLPWSEIAPQFQVPGLSSVHDLAKQLMRNDSKIERLT